MDYDLSKDEDVSIKEDGSLHGGYCYLHYIPGHEEAVLDGAFSAEKLRAIADYMDAQKRNGQA